MRCAGFVLATASVATNAPVAHANERSRGQRNRDSNLRRALPRPALTRTGISIRRRQPVHGATRASSTAATTAERCVVPESMENNHNFARPIIAARQAQRKVEAQVRTTLRRAVKWPRGRAH